MNILLATDFSAPALAAHHLVRDACWPPGSVIRVLTVLEPVSLFGEGRDLRQYDELRQQQAEADLKILARSLEGPDRRVETILQRGRAADRIVGEAEAFGAGLAVLGSRGRGPFATAFLGSVSAETVDSLRCPVLVARRSRLASLVVADDGSRSARAAVDFAASLPALKGSRAWVVSVVDFGPLWSAEEPMSSSAAGRELAAELASQHVLAAKGAAASAERLAAAGITAQADARVGRAASEIVAEARDRDVDLIVVGSRGHTGAARLMLGSVARSVITHASCSVLVVPPGAGRGTE